MNNNFSGKLSPIHFFFYLRLLSRTSTIHRTAGEGGGYFFNSSLTVPPTSQTLRHQLRDYCRELTSIHRQQLDPNWEPLVSKCKFLATKLLALQAAVACGTSQHNTFDYSLQTLYIAFRIQHLYKDYSGISIKWTPFVCRNVCYIVIPPENGYLAEI